MVEKILKISIVIPVYNVEQYVDRCIESVLQQTHTDFEVILVDDGSTDQSGYKCDVWAQNDQRVRCIHQKNKGLSSARNTGIHLCNGDYIVFLDSDDYWLSDKVLEIICERVSLYKADVLSLNFCKVQDDSIAKPYFQVERDMPIELRRNESLQYLCSNDLWIACAWNKVIRRELFDTDELEFIEGITSEDIDWCIRLALAAQQFDYCDECVIGYRQRSDSISQIMSFEKINCLKNNIEKSIKLLNEGDMQKKKILEPYISYQIGTLLFNVGQLERKKDRGLIAEEVRAWIPILGESSNKKIKAIYLSIKLLGITGTIELLRLKALMTRYKKRSKAAR